MVVQQQKPARGFTLIEVLITLLIIAIGLLGLASLQTTTLKNQMEAYQRAQALLLVEDMANRIRVNTIAARAGAYTAGTTYGVMDRDLVCPADPATATIAQNDLCAWHDALSGVGVALAGEDQGSIIGARGCIENVAGSTDGELIIRLTVAWLGMAPIAAPASTCGQDQYGDDDRFRRVVSMDTVLANLAL